MSTPYSTVAGLFGVRPSWIPPNDLERISSYAVYEDMYWNVPDTFKLMQRGSEDNPLYIPSARIIIEATNRFLGKDMQVVVDPSFGSEAEQKQVEAELKRLFKRENFYTKYATQRRYGLIRGDALWHVVADPAKLPGSRLSLYELDPGTYFPIYDDDNIDKLIGCHIVDQIEMDDKIFLHRQTYRKVEGKITTERAIFELAKWDDRFGGEIKKVKQVLPPTFLPDQITQIPVYHIKNTRTPADPFGSSEMRGIERVFAAVNQSMSDEELTLALDGLGVYATTSGPPVDEDGNEINWRLGPGRVVEIDGESDFKRVNGVSSIAPFMDHVKFIMGMTQQAVGVPDIAAGNVDVSVAESGIALALQLSPILAKNAEKEVEMQGVYEQMMYDIVKMWLPAYEGLPVTQVETNVIFADPLPVNKEAEVTRIMSLVSNGLLSIRTAHVQLSKLGYDIPNDEFAAILEEMEAKSIATPDPFMSRVAREMDGADDGSESGQQQQGSTEA